MIKPKVMIFRLSSMLHSHHCYFRRVISLRFCPFFILLFIGVAILPSTLIAQYKGTASVSQGKATSILNANLLTCSGGRVAGLGTIKSKDSLLWTVPAETQFANQNFPWASDLNNVCNGNNFKNTTEALAALDGSDIVTIDSDGEVVTAFVFADNYFEMYVNGIAVGKDKVPFTQFNSSIVRFKVKLPFVIAMLLVDWEENLGLGSELNGGFAYHPGDGGMVAVFKNSAGNIIGKTDKTWKAQTFYTSPITDLTCPTENGQNRISDLCSAADSKDGSQFYALHWPIPKNWMGKDFNDAGWPAALEYSNAVIGVNNKPAYTNFVDVFDDVKSDGQFIWSSNVVLDNEVVVRTVIGESSSAYLEKGNTLLYPNPNNGILCLQQNQPPANIERLRILTLENKLLADVTNPKFPFVLDLDIEDGLYLAIIDSNLGSGFQLMEFNRH